MGPRLGHVSTAHRCSRICRVVHPLHGGTALHMLQRQPDEILRVLSMCSAGKDQLGGKLQGTRTWIGTTECAAMLRSFGVNAKIVDFEVQAHEPLML
jgi:Peptidase family C78